MNRDYKLYVHVSPSGKRYYGITKQEPENRWGNGKKYKSNKHFTGAINKYGWDNFTHEILFNNLTEAEAKLLEQCYIALYDTTNQDKGYNISTGGEGGNGCERSEETRRKLSESRMGEKNPMYGKSPRYNMTQKEIEDYNKKIKENHADFSGKNHPMYGKGYLVSGKNNSQAKSVICITTGKIFYTGIEASKYYNIDNSTITKCCKGKRKTAGKINDTPLVWRYLNYKHNKTYRIINTKYLKGA